VTHADNVTDTDPHNLTILLQLHASYGTQVYVGRMGTAREPVSPGDPQRAILHLIPCRPTSLSLSTSLRNLPHPSNPHLVLSTFREVDAVFADAGVLPSPTPVAMRQCGLLVICEGRRSQGVDPAGSHLSHHSADSSTAHVTSPVVSSLLLR
jgi:hypothetical protein